MLLESYRVLDNERGLTMSGVVLERSGTLTPDLGGAPNPEMGEVPQAAFRGHVQSRLQDKPPSQPAASGFAKPL